jgi:hypothetical protein
VSTAAYIVASLAWAVFGFVVGYLLGRSWNALDSIDRKIPPMPLHEDDVPALRPNRKPRSRIQQIFGAVLVLLALATVIGVAVQTVRLNDVTSCQAEWNDGYTDALRQRAVAAATERAAQRELLTTVLRPGTTAQERREATERYLHSLEDADAEREEAKIPTRECG